MKNINKLILASISVALITASCSIEKRVHNSGYHITWNKLKHQADVEKTSTANCEVKEKTNKNFAKVESVAKSEALKANAEQANKVENSVLLIENKLTQTSTSIQKGNNTTAASIETSNALNSQTTIAVKSADKKSNVIKSAVKKIEKSSKAPMSSGDRELLILLLFWFFLGFLAGHRWYAGKPVLWNLLFIITAGGCGIWAIIDLVNIIRGDF